MEEGFSIGLRLSCVSNARPEGVSVFANGHKWNSPAGGWLPQQSGVWNQLPDGLHLMDATNTVTVAICSGCNFTLSSIGSTGTAKYPSIGDAGNWQVVSQVPSPV